MSKLYFSEYDDEHCCDLAYHREYMEENEIKEMKLFEAKRDTGNDYFYCKKFQDIGEVSKSCGKYCDAYKPNNGKSGRCKHYGYCYEQTDIVKILRLKEVKQ
jgi:hypothetical protein